MDFQERNAEEIPDDFQRPDDQVVFRSAVQSKSAEGYFISFGTFRTGDYLERISKADGIEDCFNFMVSVRALSLDMQPKVNFGSWKNNHLTKIPYGLDFQTVEVQFGFSTSFKQKNVCKNSLGKECRCVVIFTFNRP
jgi:hypothetical protein